MSAIIYDLNKFRKTGDKSKCIITKGTNDDCYWTKIGSGKTFNQIINSIQARYSDRQPKGGCIYTAPVSGMKLDSYGRGNVHNSVFQYMPKSKNNWNSPMPFPSDLRKVFKAIDKNKGRVMVLGYKSDPLMWMDQKYGITKKILKYAARKNVQLVINTMSDLCAHDDYIELLKDGSHSITMNMSLNDGDDRVERLLSPGAPSFKRRQAAIDKLKSKGIEVSIHEFKELPVNTEIMKRLGIKTLRELKVSND